MAETKYRYQIESDIAPFRGLLLGFFFITVGFNIDLGKSCIPYSATPLSHLLTMSYCKLCMWVYNAYYWLFFYNRLSSLPLPSAMIVKEAPKIGAMLASLIVGKASIITALSLMFGMSFANSQLSGLLLAQGGRSSFHFFR